MNGQELRVLGLDNSSGLPIYAVIPLTQVRGPRRGSLTADIS